MTSPLQSALADASVEADNLVAVVAQQATTIEDRSIASYARDTVLQNNIDSLAAQIGNLAMNVDQNKLDADVQFTQLSTAISALAARVVKLETPPVVVVPPPVPPTTPTGFLNLKSKSKLVAPAPPLSVGATVKQADTGATIRRLANGLIDYSRFTRVSPDGKYVFVMGENSTSMRIVNISDGTDAFIYDNIGEYHEPRWDYTEVAASKTFYYVRGMTFNKMTLGVGTQVIRDFTADFPGGSEIINDVEGDSSHDSRYWCWMVRKITQTGKYPIQNIFTYDKQTNTILGRWAASDLVKGSDTPAGYITWPNMVEIAPDGSKAIVHWDRAYTGNNGNLAGTHQDGPHAYPLNLAITGNVKIGVAATHSGWAQHTDGRWMFVHQNSRNDYIEASDLVNGWKADGTGVIRLLYAGEDTDWSCGFHFSKLYNKKGWVLVSTYSDLNKDWMDDQLFFLPLEANGTPLRICDTLNLYPGDTAYRNEASASCSFDGNGIYWTSNGLGLHARSVYEVRLPNNWG